MAVEAAFECHMRDIGVRIGEAECRRFEAQSSQILADTHSIKTAKFARHMDFVTAGNSRQLVHPDGRESMGVQEIPDSQKPSWWPGLPPANRLAPREGRSDFEQDAFACNRRISVGLADLTKKAVAELAKHAVT